MPEWMVGRGGTGWLYPPRALRPDTNRKRPARYTVSEVSTLADNCGRFVYGRTMHDVYKKRHKLIHSLYAYIRLYTPIYAYIRSTVIKKAALPDGHTPGSMLASEAPGACYKDCRILAPLGGSDSMLIGYYTFFSILAISLAIIQAALRKSSISVSLHLYPLR